MVPRRSGHRTALSPLPCKLGRSRAQRHRRAGAGSTVQDCGKCLASNAQSLRDFADAQSVRQVLAEDFARVCRVMHCAHRCLILVVVKVVDEFHVVFDKPENDPPVAVDRDREEALGVACQWVQPPAGAAVQVEVPAQPTSTAALPTSTLAGIRQRTTIRTAETAGSDPADSNAQGDDDEAAWTR